MCEQAGSACEYTNEEVEMYVCRFKCMKSEREKNERTRKERSVVTELLVGVQSQYSPHTHSTHDAHAINNNNNERIVNKENDDTDTSNTGIGEV